MRPFHIEIVTPDGLLFDGEVVPSTHSAPPSARSNPLPAEPPSLHPES